MMKNYKRIIAFLLILSLCLSLVACGGADKKAIIYFEIENEPTNLDPQTAQNDAELLIVRNAFEGLMRKNDEGEIVCGACSSYKKQGLTYTFLLRDGLKWSDDTPVTADDFVFGLRRAVQKSTAAPFVSRLFSIKGARDIYENNASPKSLGVKASGNKVIITLKEKDDMILETLASSVAMPCNEEFFLKTEGKYGKDASSLLSNGSYDLYKWNREKFAIRLYKSENYNGEYPAQNGGVFISLVEDKSQVSRLTNNESDIAFVPANELMAAEKNNLNILSCENTCWFLTFGNEYNLTVKTALLKAFSADLYSGELGRGLRAANSVYPSVLGIKKADGVGMPVYDINGAKQLFSGEVKNMEDSKFPASTLYYYDREEIKTAANTLLGHWQQNISAFVNMQSSNSLSALSKELDSRTLQFALFPVTANNGSVKEYLSVFGLSGDPVEAQRQLLSARNIVPFAFETTNICTNSSIKTVYMDNGNGYLDFAFVTKKS